MEGDFVVQWIVLFFDIPFGLFSKSQRDLTKYNVKFKNIL